MSAMGCREHMIYMLLWRCSFTDSGGYERGMTIWDMTDVVLLSSMSCFEA